MFFTVAGTLSHEGGHFLVARALGYNASLHYGFTDPGENETERALQQYYERWGSTGKVDSNTIRQTNFVQLIEKRKQENKLFILGGPVQTMLTGCIGFLLLIIYRKNIIGKQVLNTRQWLLIFLSLFWLRQVANAMMGLFIFLAGRSVENANADEIKLAFYFNVPSMSIVAGTALIGLIISLIVIFVFVPVRQRITFIAAGLAGGIIGFIGWFGFAGPWVMP